MIGLTDAKFKKEYFKDDNGQEKLLDNFQTGEVKLLPFTLNPLSGNLYDSSCGVLGVAGEFYRIITKSSVTAIKSADEAAESLKIALKEKFKMSDEENARFISIFKDILFENNMLNVIDAAFLAFVPMKFFEKERDGNNSIKKYRAGQPKIADYYVSLAELCEDMFAPKPKDIFSQTVIDCLTNENSFKYATQKDKYFILPFIKESFAKDLKWLLGQSNSVVVKYLPLFLHFYACYSLIQTLVFMNQNNWDLSIAKPKAIYYMLTSEKVTASIDGVRKGWSASDNLSDTFLDKMSSYAQALDILNLMFEENNGLMTFQEIKGKFSTIGWDDDAKALCESILCEYQTRKRNSLQDRGTETNALPELISTEVQSFDEFMDRLLEMCMRLQSKDYPRMKHAMYAMADVRMLMHRREHKVLAFDEELLLFLIAMMTKGERVRLETLYKQFDSYGIRFSFQTKSEISDYLLNLNLLERKSDSGEAQYVRVVL